jgi:MFS transporter, SP family, arabinose:H+ symporter
MRQIVLSRVGFNVFIASFTLGVGGTGLVQREVFPIAVRGLAEVRRRTADWLAKLRRHRRASSVGGRYRAG